MRKPNEKLTPGEMFGNTLMMMKAGIVGDFGLRSDRENALRYGGDDDDLIIDTCHTIDTGFYETGVIDKRYESGGDWVIVEEYPTEKKAKTGHKKWVKKLTSKKIPDALIDVCIGKRYFKEN